MSERDFSRRCAADLEELIRTKAPDTIAAFIGEPVLGTGGLIPPPEGYWDEIQPVLRKHDILLIADEVICGFGRLGTCVRLSFIRHRAGSHHHRQGAHQRLLAAVRRDRRREGLRRCSSRARSSSGRSRTATRIPRIRCARPPRRWRTSRSSSAKTLTDNAREVGRLPAERPARELRRTSPFVGEVRGVGLLAAIEFVADP